jgi:hypothetical protein
MTVCQKNAPRHATTKIRRIRSRDRLTSHDDKTFGRDTDGFKKPLSMSGEVGSLAGDRVVSHERSRVTADARKTGGAPQAGRQMRLSYG